METSKLEAVYFQPGFWGNLHQPLRCLAWGAAAPSPRLQAGAWKRGPRCFSTDSPILPERTEAVLRAPSPEGKAYLSGGMDWVATICTWLMRGRWLREPRQLPKGPGSPGPARLGRSEHFWLFLPIFYHYYCRFLKNPINTHFKWNLKLLLCERTL